MIVLVNPWSTPSAKKPLPMSVLALGSLLEGEFDYEIVDANLIADPVAHIVDLALRKPRPLTAIGISVMPGPQLNHAVPMSKALKAALPDVPIVWGGYFASQHADVCLREPYVDFVIGGQGEHAFLALMRVLTKGGALSSVPGLSWKDSDQGFGGLQTRSPYVPTVRANARAPLIPLDDLPDWPYERVSMDRYFHRHYLGDRVGTHHSSFGCPFACNFCAVVGMSNRRWMPQSPARVERVVRRLHTGYGADALQFHDMDFFVSEDRTREIAERITPLGIKWWALGRVDELMRYSDATWAVLKASGLTMAFCGAESGSDAVLKRMNKGGRAAATLTIDLARRMREYGIVPEFSFVLGNPPDPVSDVHQTIDFVRRVKQANPYAEIILYTYTPVPLEGTLYDDARELGFRFPDTLEEWTSERWREFALRRDPRTPWIDGDWKRRVRDFESVLNAYYPTITDGRLTGPRRALLRAVSALRYHARLYDWPLELRLLHRVFQYQRPETTGF